jgi:hypothetical protein
MRKHATRGGNNLVEREDIETPELRSLVLPWASMVIAALIATAVVVLYQTHEDSHYNEAFDFESNDSVKLFTTNESILERLLSAAHPVEQHHVHKPVYVEEHAPLFPLTAADRLGFFLAILGLMVAAGGGIGGGGILVPIYILVMGFSPKHGKKDK